MTAVTPPLSPPPTSNPIDAILQLPQRKLVVARDDIFLNRAEVENEIFIFIVEESRGSAGGRTAGSGHRRISKVYGFSCNGGKCTKFFETDDQSKIDLFEIPYSSVTMDIRLSDGKPYVVQGVVDPDLIVSYRAATTTMDNLK